MPLHRAVDEWAEATPDSPALWWEGSPISFAELRDHVNRVGGAVAAASEPGDRIAVLSWNRPEVLALLLGIPGVGRIAVPLNARLHPAELGAQLLQCGATFLIGERELVDPVASLASHGLSRIVRFGDEFDSLTSDTRPALANPLSGVPFDDTRPAWIIFTSGSTGRPKGAMLTHASLLAAVDAAAAARPVAPDDCYLYPFPLFHVSAYNVLIQHRFGRPVVLLRAFAADEVLAACARHDVTTMSLAPTMISMLLDHPSFDRSALGRVRTIGYGASAISEQLLRRVIAETDVGLSQGYGMTELSGNACFLDAEDHRRAATTRPALLRSAGVPAPGVEIRLAEDGEILVRAPQTMAGYWNEPELTRRTITDGWLHTGDIGRVEDGYLFVVDRSKDVIISGGENIASREVEDAIAEHPAVSRVAVVAVPDPQWGEAVCAVVARRPDTALTAADVIEHCRARLAGYKRPRHVLFCDEVPLNANSKLDKPFLRSWATDELDQLEQDGQLGQLDRDGEGTDCRP